MVLIMAETVIFLVLISLVLHFKILSRPQLGEKEIGPYNIVYIRNVGSIWSTSGKIKTLQEFLQAKNLTPDLYIGIYLSDPGKSNTNAIPGVIGAVINNSELPPVEEPFATTTIAPRYVATAANANRIIGLNKYALYPQLRAYMNVNGYTHVKDEFIELYHMGQKNGFGKGFYTEVCTRIRKQNEEELKITEEYENRGIDAASLLFGGKGRFGKWHGK